MKKSLLSAVAAVALLSPALAHAAVDPIYGGADPDLDQACSDIQKPNDASGFMSFAENFTSNSTSVTEDTGIVSDVGVGPSIFTIGNYRNAHVNGQSVNIHAYGDMITTYLGGHTVTYSTKTTTTTVKSASCHVHKETNGNQNDTPHPGYQIAPQGLQTTDPVTKTSIEVTTGTRQQTVTGPWVDPNASSFGKEFVICISPSKPPPKGTWRGQNGYVSQIGGRTCSTVWHNELGTSQPTASLPPV